MRAGRVAVVVAGLWLVAASCSGTETEETTGVVVDVTGDIVTVDRFAIQTEDGEVLEFEVAPAVTFADGAPIGHLSEHLQSGAPVVVQFEQLDDGTRVVHEIDDA